MNKIKLIIVGLIIIMFSGCGLTNELNYTVKEIAETRSEIVLDNSSFEVDNILLPHAIEFINEAHKYGVNVDSISSNYMGIYVDYLPVGYSGMTFKQYPNGLDYSIVIPAAISSINKTRVLVFHEMAHKYLPNGHCHEVCREIMSTVVTSYAFYGEWEKQKKTLFKNLEHEAVKK